MRLDQVAGQVGFSAISIHAPTWGATAKNRRRCHTCPAAPDFNPRTHVGCDVNIPANPNALKFQSTHPRGVRRDNMILDIDIAKFQSTHPRGVRPGQTPQTPSRGNFNPRTHVGCDYTYPLSSMLRIYFNPRTHVGCDRVTGTNIKFFLLLLSAKTF